MKQEIKVEIKLSIQTKLTCLQTLNYVESSAQEFFDSFLGENPNLFQLLKSEETKVLVSSGGFFVSNVCDQDWNFALLPSRPPQSK